MQIPLPAAPAEEVVDSLFLLPSDALSRLAKKREREKDLGKKNECVHCERVVLNHPTVDVKPRNGSARQAASLCESEWEALLLDVLDAKEPEGRALDDAVVTRVRLDAT